MREVGRFFGVLAACFVWCLQGRGAFAHALPLEHSPYVQFSPDGRAFTTNPGDRQCRWYDYGTELHTGIASSLRTPGEGEHYFSYERQGRIPVGRWVVRHTPGQCIHHAYPGGDGGFHGLQYGRWPCHRTYYSGWMSYCADCGSNLAWVLMYMSREAAASIGYLDMGMTYYYLCPYCRNLEQGAGIPSHRCQAVSLNRYMVRYHANGGDVGGHMPDSWHMYNDGSVYENAPITAQNHLRPNGYSRRGYIFLGWNTRPDGLGAAYGDGQIVKNLTNQNYQGGAEGVVHLYAQWSPRWSWLDIDPGEGSYKGEKGVWSRKGYYGDRYALEGDRIQGRLWGRVTFDARGGGSVEDRELREAFAGWEPTSPLEGGFSQDVYVYTAPHGHREGLRALYSQAAIVLPPAVRPGYVFGGWYGDENCSRRVGGAGDRYEGREDVRLYAGWEELLLEAEADYGVYGGSGAVDLRWSQWDGWGNVYRLWQRREQGEWVLLPAESGELHQGNSLKDVAARDMAAPSRPEGIRCQRQAGGALRLHWDEAGDEGTAYYHRAAAYRKVDLAEICVSNQTENQITSGIRGYRYLADSSPYTSLDADMGTLQKSRSLYLAGKALAGKRYLHLAAEDVAGNVGESVHIPLYWDGNSPYIYTQALELEGKEGSVWRAAPDRYYLRTGEKEVYWLTQGAGILGDPGEGWEWSRQIFYVNRNKEGESASQLVYLGRQGTGVAADQDLALEERGEGFLLPLGKGRSWLRDGGRTLGLRYAFGLGREGEWRHISPGAEAVWRGSSLRSNIQEDKERGIWICGDGTAPQIMGAEALDSAPVLGKGLELVLEARDMLSGLDSWGVAVRNGDNGMERELAPAEDGRISLEVNARDSLFAGGYSLRIWAVDRVGNRIDRVFANQSFALEASLEKIRGKGAFRRGEWGILRFWALGYVDRVEVELPPALAGGEEFQVFAFDYSGRKAWQQQEAIELAIPMTAPEGEHGIMIRAYKGEAQLERYPLARVVDVQGSITGDLRSRLR